MQNVVSTQRNEKSVQQSHCEYAEYFARCLFGADLFSLLINILIKTDEKVQFSHDVIIKTDEKVQFSHDVIHWSLAFSQNQNESLMMLVISTNP